MRYRSLTRTRLLGDDLRGGAGIRWSCLRGGLTWLFPICFLLVPGLMGCGFQKPTLRLRDIEVAGLDFRRLELVLDLAVSNPNDYQISLHGLEYGLTAGGQRFAGGSLPRPVTPLAARQTTVVKAPLTVEFARLVPLLRKLGAGEQMDYQLTAKATFNFVAFKVPVTLQRSGRLPALRAPSWRLVDVKLTSGAEPTALVVFEVDNPNRFALPLRSLSGVLKYGDQPLLRVDRPALSPVPAGKTARVTVPVKLDAAGAARALAAALTSRQRIGFEGKLELDPPVALHGMLIDGLAKDE